MDQLFALGMFPLERKPRTSALCDIFQKEFSMPKFAIGDRVDKATGDQEGGVVVAVFSTDDGNFRYAVDMEGYGALQFLTEEKLVVHPC
jgi:hypothetical protein